MVPAKAVEAKATATAIHLTSRMADPPRCCIYTLNLVPDWVDLGHERVTLPACSSSHSDVRSGAECAEMSLLESAPHGQTVRCSLSARPGSDPRRRQLAGARLPRRRRHAAFHRAGARLARVRCR